MHNPQSAPDYLLTFSSFYKAMYARDKLMEQGIGSQLRRVPTQLLRSCGQALYLTGQDLQQVLAILAQSQIDTRGIFMVTHGSGSPAYRRIQ